MAEAPYTLNLSGSNNEDWTAGLFAYCTAPGVPLDVSDDLFEMHVKATPDAAEAVLVLSTTNGRLTIGGDDNNIPALNVPKARAQQVPPGTYVQDLLHTRAGHTRRIAKGTFIVDDGVTP